MNIRHIIISGGALAAFGVIGAALLAGVHDLTAETIAAQKRQAVLNAIHQVMPPTTYDNDPVANQTILTNVEALGGSGPFIVYRGRLDGQPSSLAIEAIAPNGYSGAIHLLVGIDRTGEIIGVRVTEHKETPGLGDDIEVEKSPWIKGFNGLSVDNPPAAEWAVKRDGGRFDQFTGATITPRAVVSAVHRTLAWVAENRTLIDNAPAEPPS